MKIAVRYLSKTGHTKSVAEAIAKAVGVRAQPITEPLEEHADILFLGSALYAAHIAPELGAFLDGVKGKAGEVVNFSTATLLPGTEKQVRRLCEARGIAMAKEEFHCKGSFHGIYRGHPDKQDLNAAEKFAVSVVRARKG